MKACRTVQKSRYFMNKIFTTELLVNIAFLWQCQTWWIMPQWSRLSCKECTNDKILSNSPSFLLCQHCNSSHLPFDRSMRLVINTVCITVLYYLTTPIYLSCHQNSEIGILLSDLNKCNETIYFCTVATILLCNCLLIDLFGISLMMMHWCQSVVKQSKQNFLSDLHNI